jgi:hypothetical protein
MTATLTVREETPDTKEKPAPAETATPAVEEPASAEEPAWQEVPSTSQEPEASPKATAMLPEIAQPETESIPVAIWILAGIAAVVIGTAVFIWRRASKKTS